MGSGMIESGQEITKEVKELWVSCDQGIITVTEVSSHVAEEGTHSFGDLNPCTAKRRILPEEFLSYGVSLGLIAVIMICIWWLAFGDLL
jgi:hypothetical protein